VKERKESEENIELEDNDWSVNWKTKLKLNIWYMKRNDEYVILWTMKKADIWYDMINENNIFYTMKNMKMKFLICSILDLIWRNIVLMKYNDEEKKHNQWKWPYYDMNMTIHDMMIWRKKAEMKKRETIERAIENV